MTNNITRIALYLPFIHGHTYTIKAYNVKDLAGNVVNPDKNKATVSYPLEGMLINFNYEDYGTDTLLGKSFINAGFCYEGKSIVTNYGYNFDINATSLFYYFKGDDMFSVSCPYSMDFQGFSYCQLSGLSNDTLLIEGYENNLLKYRDKITYNNQWTDAKTDFHGVDKIKFSILNNGGIADFNFDRFLFEVGNAN